MRLTATLVLVSSLALAGCGSGWTSIPLNSPDAALIEGSERTRVSLDDGQVIELRVLRMEYPYLWGERYLGENMPSRQMRIDLRRARSLEVRASRPED